MQIVLARFGSLEPPCHKLAEKLALRQRLPRPTGLPYFLHQSACSADLDHAHAPLEAVDSVEDDVACADDTGSGGGGGLVHVRLDCVNGFDAGSEDGEEEAGFGAATAADGGEGVDNGADCGLDGGCAAVEVANAAEEVDLGGVVEGGVCGGGFGDGGGGLEDGEGVELFVFAVKFGFRRFSLAVVLIVLKIVVVVGMRAGFDGAKS